MNKRIDKLVLNKFRGATTKTTLGFDKRKPMVLIFGENGTGKSSIVDAIDLVCNKSAGSIKMRSSTDERKHLVAIGNQAKDFTVELSCGANTWIGRIDGREIIVEGDSSLPKAFILRRSQLLKLVDAKPADRYDVLRRFVDAQNVEGSEQALRNALNESSSRLNAFTQQNVEADSALRELWQSENSPGSPDKTERDWADEKSQADPLAVKNLLSEVTSLLRQFNLVITQQTDDQNAQQELQIKTAELHKLQNSISSGSQAQETNLKLITLLRQVEDYLAAPHDKAHCPVCLSTYDADQLRRELAQRADSMTAVDKLNQKLSAATKAKQNAEAVAQKSRSLFTQAAQSLALALQKSKLAEVTETQLDITKYRQLRNGGSNATLQSAQQAEQLLHDTNLLRSQLQPLQTQLQKDLNQHTAIKQAYERTKNAKQQAEEEERVAKRLKQALQIAHETRIAFTQDILDKVKDECCRLFARIHPNEPYELRKLRLDTKTKGSLHQDAHFDGHDDVPPQAYFSESHLDTLGFCFWLSIAKLSSGGDALIVLDDAFTSVDAQHIDRIIDLLSDECDSFNQIFITTHSRRWLDRYNNSEMPKNKTHVVELLRWQRAAGVCVVDGKPPIEELKEMLKPSQKLDRQAVCAKSGVLLERALDHLAKLYGCRMARNRDNAYTLKPLCDATKELFKKIKIKRLQKDASGGIIEPNSYEPSLQPLWQKISDHVIVRNQVGAHFNANAVEYSDADIEDFGGYAVDMVSALVCHSCDALAQTNKGAYFACGCGMLRMEPHRI